MSIVNAYPFKVFSGLTFQFQHAEIGVSSCTELPDGKTKLGGNNQEVSSSTDINTRVVLKPSQRKSVLKTSSCGVDIPEASRCHFLPQTSSQRRSEKLHQR